MNEMLKEGKKDLLQYYIFKTRMEMGKFAAELAIQNIEKLLKEKAEIRMIFASAPSQSEFLYHLTRNKKIDWSRIVGFHMDEYLGLPSNSDQLFRKYLEKNLTEVVNMKAFHFIDSTADPKKEKVRYTTLLKEKPIDIVCLGIGENGHIAFNDPPVADFKDQKSVKLVALDQYSRQQQVNDGCFSSIQDVPTHALTLTIPSLIEGEIMICVVPGNTKQKAIQEVLNMEVGTSCPATILRRHHNAHLIMDKEAYGGL